MRSAKSPARYALLAVLVAALTPAPPAVGQSVRVGEPLEHYLRLLQLTGEASGGSFLIRPLMDAAPPFLKEGAHPWSAHIGSTLASPDRRTAGKSLPWGGEAGASEVRLRMFANTRHPFGGNDGAVWQGKGFTTAFEAGGWMRWGALSIRVQPVFTVSQNAAFELAPVQIPGMPAHAYPWRRIDLPQRFGEDRVSAIHPGESEVRLDLGPVTLGGSSRDLWWGPGVHNAIVLGNNAPGILHGFLGTRRPVGIGIGDLEAHWIWGGLEQSDYFDPASEQTDRFLTGLAVTYGPSFAEGLHFGLARIFYGFIEDGGPELGDVFLVFQGLRKSGLATPEDPQGNDRADQALSLFARWVFPASGLEIYGEWARNDHSWDFRDFFTEPEHSQGYTLGLRKAKALDGGRRLVAGAELVNLQQGRTAEVRPAPVFYAHHIVRQGYTNEGQLIGAPVGPGGNAQHLSLDLYDRWGRAGLLLERRAHDNDAYYAYAEASDLDSCCHHVGLSGGLNGLVFAGPVDLGGSMTVVREFNRYFEHGNDVWNFHFSLSAAWRPRG